MPRYQYRCSDCETTITLRHLSDETPSECPECFSKHGLVKLLTKFSTEVKKTQTSAPGHITEKFIKDAKKELKQQKQELKNKTS